MSTKETILTKALELFNKKGIEYTGVRELAGELGMRVSNISYYFPSKDDLVTALADELKELNNETFSKNSGNTISDFLAMRLQTFHNQYKYRCLFVSFVHLVAHNPTHSKNYAKTEHKRFESMRSILNMLSAQGYINNETEEGMLIGHISLLTRFWISEARITYPDKKEDEVIKHYMLLLCDIMNNHATAKGKKGIRSFIQNQLS